MNKQNVLVSIITASILRGSTDNLINRIIFLLAGAFIAFVIILIIKNDKKYK